MKKFSIAIAAILLATSAWSACRYWTTTTTYNGRTVTCSCSDCGYGATCNCH